jgi:hypothetical protein
MERDLPARQLWGDWRFPYLPRAHHAEPQGFGRCDRSHRLLFYNPFVFWTRIKFEYPLAPEYPDSRV